jgi:malonyl-CoA/methylmalonyl-CoA synthetase
MDSFIKTFLKFAHKIAVTDSTGSYNYGEILQKSERIATEILNLNEDIKGKCIIFSINPGFNYISTLFGIWRAGAVAVPIYLNAPDPLIAYMVKDTDSKLFISDNSNEKNTKENARKLQIHYLNVESQEFKSKAKLADIQLEENALVIYTSGTTGQPKGVLSTHKILEFQIKTLVEAWHWSSEDCIINVLPLHHVHGLVNALLCPLYVGAGIKFLDSFSTEKVWDCFKSGRINVFMAVPTIYIKLIADYENSDETERNSRKKALSKFRLMVSGSAALSVQTFDKWHEISGHYLLERYGMTEIGMAISNPYEGIRKPGAVGFPLKGVEIRLYDESKNNKNAMQGEIQVKGPNVFKFYLNKTDATKSTFTEDGWFKTGDMAILEEGYYRILGRISTDIIKSGGYKLSALEIEEAIRQHPAIEDAAVLGIEDEEWGEIVAAAIILKSRFKSEEFKIKDLKDWLKAVLSNYKIPKKIILLDSFPRNAVGKVIKKDLIKLF